MPPSRLLGLDIARAFAVLGMVIVNYALVMVDGDGEPGWLAAIPQLFQGRAAATFVILAGVGLTLLTRRARESGDRAEIGAARRRILRRALFLLVAGLLYFPIYSGDILHFYGVYLAIAAFAFTLSDRGLWGVAIAANLCFMLLLVTLDYEAGWNWQTLEYADPWTAAGLARRIFFNGFHPVLPWFAFIAVGLWLGRRPLIDRAWRRRTLLIAGSIAVATEAVSRLLVQHAVEASIATGGTGELAEALLSTQAMPPMPQYVLAAGATAVAAILLCVEAVERMGERVPVRILAAAGQLSLTLYVAHVLIGMVVLEAFGRLYGQSLGFAMGCAVAFWALGLAFSARWRARFRRGPLEALMRRVAGE